MNYTVTAAPTPATMVSQWLRLEYSFSVLPATRTGPAAGRYSVTVSNDYLTLLRRTQVRGSVYASTALLANGFADAIQTAASLATAQAWAWQQRVFPGVDEDGNAYTLPPEVETEYEFVPRVDGVAMVPAGTEGQTNVRLWRVRFTFAEILPNYPVPS